MTAFILSLHPATLAFLGGVPMAILFAGITWRHVECAREYERKRWER